MSFYVINGIILFIVFFLLLVLSMVWPPDSPWAPWWRTNKKVARGICNLAKIKKGDVVYDLGCGDGIALLTSAKEHKATGVGIEIDPLRFLIAKMRMVLHGVNNKIEIKRKSFFDEDISKATVVIVYLVPKTLNRLKSKFLKELKPGTRIVSFRYEINLPLGEYDKKNNLRLYVISKK